MLRSPTTKPYKKIKSKLARRLKKYARYCIKKDRDMRGPKVFTYKVEDGITVTTVKPKQNGAKARPIKYAFWIYSYFSELPNR